MNTRALVACLAAGCAPTPPGDAGEPGDSSARPTVAFTGVAYQFRSHAPLEGARVSLAEHPEVVAVSDAEGVYRLEDVPAGLPVTPRVELAGHATAHHQTFTATEDVERLHLQVVPDDLYAIIVDVLESSGRAVQPDACQVVTTITDPSAWEAPTWAAYLERGDAGLVPGATATLTPSAGERLYFNEVVLPDPTQPVATTDGGVLWLNVQPPGRYRLTAEDPDGAFVFPEVEVTCEPGRFVNANPPYGLTAQGRR